MRDPPKKKIKKLLTNKKFYDIINLQNQTKERGNYYD